MRGRRAVRARGRWGVVVACVRMRCDYNQIVPANRARASLKMRRVKSKPANKSAT